MIQWGTVAEWFSGVSSLVVAVAALYLARDTYRHKLGVSCDIQVVPKDCEMLSVSVVNLKSWSVHIEGFGVKIGKKYERLSWFDGVSFVGGTSYKIPVAIGNGERATYRWPVKEGAEQLVNEKVVKNMSDAKKLRFVFSTTRGQSKRMKPKKPFVDAMITALHKQTEKSK